MTFGEYLKKLLDAKGLTTAYLSKVSGANRGKLYYVYDGKRKLTSDELFSIVNGVDFSNEQIKTLINLYFEELYGSGAFSDIKHVESIIQKDLYKCEPSESINTDQSGVNGYINVKTQLINSIVYLCSNDKDILTNFSFSDKNIDSTVFWFVENKALKLTHILDFSTKAAAIENLELIFSSVKYMYNNSFPVYRYINTEQMEYCNLFPYYFVGKKHALFYNGKNGVFIEDANAVKALRRRVTEEIKKCTPLGIRTEDILLIKSTYEREFDLENDDNFLISYYPSTCQCTDGNFIRGVARDDLPDREKLVKIAENYYKTYNGEDANYKQITTFNGLVQFAKTGNVAEVFNSYVKPADKKSRIRMLKKMLNDVNGDRLFLLDEKEINISNGIIFETVCGGLTIYGYDCKKENFCYGEKFFANIKDAMMSNIFRMFCDYLIASRKVCSKELAKRFIKGLIAEMEFDSK